MLKIETICNLEPISALDPERIYELLDYCRMEYFSDGQDPFKLPGISDQTMFLIEGVLDLSFSDSNRLRIQAGSEWSRQPLGKNQPAVTAAVAVGRVGIMCINNELMDIMEVRNARLQQQDGKSGSGKAVDSKLLGNGYLLNPALKSLEHFRMWPFMQLSSEHLSKLLNLVEIMAVWEDEVVVQEGEPGDYYYLLEKGRAEVSRQVGGATMILAELKPGEAFGEEALISGARRNATVTMRSNGVLLRLQQDDFLQLMQQPLLHYIDYRTALNQVASGARWLDVRHPPEFRRSKLSGAINVPLNDIRNAIGALDKTCSYIIYCQDRRRSSVAAFILARAGYDVSVLDGGLQSMSDMDAVNN